MSHRWRPSPVALLIGAIIVLLSIGGYFFLQHSVDQQETALLGEQHHRRGRHRLVGLRGHHHRALERRRRGQDLHPRRPDRLRQLREPDREDTPGADDVLVRKDGDHYVVVAASGSSFQPGETLSGEALATVQRATGTGVISGPVTSNGKTSIARFAVSASGGLYVYEQFTIPVHINIATAIGSRLQQPQCGPVRPGPTESSNLLVTSTKAAPAG